MSPCTGYSKHQGRSKHRVFYHLRQLFDKLLFSEECSSQGGWGEGHQLGAQVAPFEVLRELHSWRMESQEGTSGGWGSGLCATQEWVRGGPHAKAPGEVSCGQRQYLRKGTFHFKRRRGKGSRHTAEGGHRCPHGERAGCSGAMSQVDGATSQKPWRGRGVAYSVPSSFLGIPNLSISMCSV